MSRRVWRCIYEGVTIALLSALLFWALLSAPGCTPADSGLAKETNAVREDAAEARELTRRSTEAAASSKTRFERVGELSTSGAGRMAAAGDEDGIVEQQEIAEHAVAGVAEQQTIIEGQQRVDGRLTEIARRMDAITVLLTRVQPRRTWLAELPSAVKWIAGAVLVVGLAVVFWQWGIPYLVRPITRAIGDRIDRRSAEAQMAKLDYEAIQALKRRDLEAAELALHARVASERVRSKSYHEAYGSPKKASTPEPRAEPSKPPDGRPS